VVSAVALAVGFVGVDVMAGAASAQAASTTLRPGDSGARVRELQRELTDLGYWLGGVDGQYGNLTRQAVVALQKAAGISRDGIAGRNTQSALDRGVRPSARSSSGLVVEVNLSRQLLLVVDDGSVKRILNTSTGSGQTYTRPDGTRGTAITPRGRFTVSRQIDAWRTSPLGRLYRPKYFTASGIAVHGATSVPAYPASHGCVRLSLAAMDMMWANNYLPLRGTVYVY
jgi:hypothetical protein